MLKRLRAKHPVGFCVLSEVLFLGSLLLASYLIVFALVLFGVDLERVDSYFLSAVQEAVGMVVALVILGRTGKMYLLRRRGSGFFNGLLVGMYPLVLIGYSLYTKLMFGMPEDGRLQPAFSIFSFFLSMALVGVAEEFIFRGVIAQSLLERFGTGRAGVWKACLLSGLLFGAAHLTNLLSSAPFGVLMQCVFAASLGTLFAAIYFRTGNLWVTEDVAESISGYDASMMLSILIYLIPTLFLLRKKKIGEVALYFGRDCAPAAAPAPEENGERLR
jgi:membrane protease YdiL (CAAX protease family)